MVVRPYARRGERRNRRHSNRTLGPALKPLFQRWLSNFDVSFSKFRSNATPISLVSKPRSQGHYKLGGADQFECAASRVSHHITGVSNRESNDSLLETGRGEYLGRYARENGEGNDTTIGTSGVSISMRSMAKR